MNNRLKKKQIFVFDVFQMYMPLEMGVSDMLVISLTYQTKIVQRVPHGYICRNRGAYCSDVAILKMFDSKKYNIFQSLVRTRYNLVTAPM